MKVKNGEVADYVIASVIPHNGRRMYIHEEVSGAECYIADAEVGYRGTIMFFPDYDDRFHRLHTSNIEAINEVADGNRVEIVTQNTTYVLERINFDYSFRGIQVYNPANALKEIMDFLKKHRADVSSVPVIDLAWKLYTSKKEFGVVDYGAIVGSLCSGYIPCDEVLFADQERVE